MKPLFTAVCVAMGYIAIAQSNTENTPEAASEVQLTAGVYSPVKKSGLFSFLNVESITAENQTENDQPSTAPTSNYKVSTLAGNGTAGNTNDTGLAALLHSPMDVAVDTKGNVYVADAANNKIRKISPTGVVSNFAGNGVPGSANGIGKASFSYPVGVAVDKAGNVYVADKGNHQIKKVTPDGFVTTFAGSGIRAGTDGKGKAAAFDKPVSVTVDALGNVYVADQCNHKIRKITPDGMVSTLAGNGEQGKADGNGATAMFDNPSSVATDSLGNVYVADYGNNSIRKITPQGIVSTLTGSDLVGSSDGIANIATFYFPDGLAVDDAGNVYIADQVNNKIRKLSPTGQVSTLAGSGTAGSNDGVGQSASFYNPAGLAVDREGHVYVADYNNHKIRKIEPAAAANNATTQNIIKKVCNQIFSETH